MICLISHDPRNTYNNPTMTMTKKIQTYKHLVYGWLMIPMFFAIHATDGLSCTTVVASGKATVDGRPLLFKTADGSADSLRTNIYIYNHSGKYAYIGCARLNFPTVNSIFYGQNEKGFAMVNNTAHDLDGTTNPNAAKGNIIRLGLENCATVEEFEQMLQTIKPFVYGSNYGCIDAMGNAAYFECGKDGYKKYDANDPKVAPNGYLVRTNWAMSGNVNKGTGVSRFMMISKLAEQAFASGGISVSRAISWGRCLQHGLTHTNLLKKMPKNEQHETPIHFTDFIPRYTTGGMVVIQGVLKEENPLLTTSWLAMGNPLVTPVIPLWITTGKKLPNYVGKDCNGKCPMGEWAMTLKDYIWEYKGGECYNYIALNRLVNKKHTGILQQLLRMEEPILAKGRKLLETSREKGLNYDDIHEFYQWVDMYVDSHYKELGKTHNLEKRK